MKQTTIHIQNNGPYEIEGSFKLVDEAGNAFDIPNSILLCRCGYSHDKPFCDGTHHAIDFESDVSAPNLMVEV